MREYLLWNKKKSETQNNTPVEEVKDFDWLVTVFGSGCPLRAIREGWRIDKGVNIHTEVGNVYEPASFVWKWDFLFRVTGKKSDRTAPAVILHRVATKFGSVLNVPSANAELQKPPNRQYQNIEEETLCTPDDHVQNRPSQQ